MIPPPDHRAAICLTPDARYFKAAIVAARSVLAQEPDIPASIVILCDAHDVAPGYDAMAADLRARITLLPWEKSSETAALPLGRHVTHAAYRRLFLPALLDGHYQRIVYLDADMVVMRPGLSRLLSLPLHGRPLAAAIDMIFLKDFEDGPLTAEFRAYRAGLGLPLERPYFNSGLLVIDPDLWRAQRVTEKALAFLAAAPARCQFHDQSALNAVLQDSWLALSPRYNFMGDFQLLDLESLIAPVVMHFVNHPKPWHFAEWAGEDRFAQIYREALTATPWAADAVPSPHALEVPASLSPAFAAFRRRLLAYLRTQAFADTPPGWP
ncbi:MULTISPECIES: glycosyltransferase family 8 protein [unclassified Chelatococcus]|uniref:glycosyltransferase family 8 protein n=1 Tax=unclassified Chelatococcus TaxID=2638111 RepID=UPI001BCF26B3|nr:MULTISPECIES: glycosyltransferase family 8 protein [unclassified Chelatococcus]MBS7698209.1 glycosyltransferase family 8 protein [Chelatococcus sp. YT9]MBX3559871.1 glycosyltransferase family 8 protein [Chelatococcus sp.]